MKKGNSSALVLAHLPGITPRRLAHWRNNARSLEDVLERSGDGLWTSAEIQVARDAAKRERDLSERLGVTLIALDTFAYPDLLSRIPDPPLLLRVRGNLSLSRPVAVVGARRADPYGRGISESFARSLSCAGTTVVSGLAYGVDAVAHRAALGERGGTIAVLGTGVDIIYPRDHAGLAADILASGGALVSELPCGEGPQRGHFPRRNRILAGLTLGTLVVQAGEKSGSLITARLALDYNRLVWTIPGRIGDALSVGTLALAREGAPIVTSHADILADIAPLGTPLPAEREDLPVAPEPPPTSLDPLLAAIGPTGVTIDELASSTGRPRSVLLSELLKRELSRQIIAEPGGIYRLTGR